MTYLKVVLLSLVSDRDPHDAYRLIPFRPLPSPQVPFSPGLKTASLPRPWATSELKQIMLELDGRTAEEAMKVLRYRAPSRAERVGRRRRGSRRCVRIAAGSARGLGSAKPAVECDLVLSSGFLAFGSHSGFLKAAQDEGVRVMGVMGTSAGALTGSLFCAGYSADEILRETTRDPPWKLLRLNLCFWEEGWGLFSLEAVVERLRELLPPTFEDLDRDFACAVLSSEGAYTVLDSGALPEAVAASAAIPFLFTRVPIPGREDVGPFYDGGAKERIGLKPWRARIAALDGANGDERGNPQRLALVHLIQKSFGPLSGNDETSPDQDNFKLVTSPKSGVTFLSLGDYGAQYEGAQARTRDAIAELRRLMVKKGLERKKS